MISVKFDTKNVLDRRFARDVAIVVGHGAADVAAALATHADQLGIRAFVEELFSRARLQLGPRFVVHQGDRQ